MDSTSSSSRDPRVFEFAHEGDLLHPKARGLAERYASAVEVLVAKMPPSVGWNFWVGPGWYKLVTDLDVSLTACIADYVPVQVKEKFGALRYYVERQYTEHPRHDDFLALLRDAEAASLHICEVCGERGALQKGPGAWRTLCRGCASRCS